MTWQKEDWPMEMRIGGRDGRSCETESFKATGPEKGVIRYWNDKMTYLAQNKRGGVFSMGIQVLVLLKCMLLCSFHTSSFMLIYFIYSILVAKLITLQIT
jgi:hypothetical protein